MIEIPKTDGENGNHKHRSDNHTRHFPENIPCERREVDAIGQPPVIVVCQHEHILAAAVLNQLGIRHDAGTIVVGKFNGDKIGSDSPVKQPPREYAVGYFGLHRQKAIHLGVHLIAHFRDHLIRI